MLRFSLPRLTPVGPFPLGLAGATAGGSGSRGSHLKALVASGAGLIALALLLPWHLGRVQGSSMTPTLPPGSLFLYERGTLRPDQLRQGDIVVLRHAGELWIKRVYARAGDQVLLWHEDDGTTIRRIPIAEAELPRYQRLAAWICSHGPTKITLVRQQIPPGHVFVLGDASTSVDSRTLGPLPAARIAGRVLPLPGQHLEQRPDAEQCLALAL